MAASSDQDVAKTFLFDEFSDDSDSDYSSDGESLVRSDSSSSSFNDAPWIIEHILESKAGDRQLPLRVMFSFNSGQGLPNLRDVHQLWRFQKQGQKIITFLSSLPNTERAQETSDQAADTQQYGNSRRSHDPFMNAGLDRLLEIEFANTSKPMRRASQGLPPKFIEKMILTKIFRTQLKDVNYELALTGLDYFDDIEETRRCCLREAAQRLNITSENWRRVLGNNKRALEWIENVLEHETEIGALHKTTFINLRIWTMIHELKAESFYKPNVLAMLNTLFPPTMSAAMHMPIKIHTLHQHRARLYNCLVEMDNQPHFIRAAIADKFLSLYLERGMGLSWEETRATLVRYMKLSEVMIRQAKIVHGVNYFGKPTINQKSARYMEAVDQSGSSAAVEQEHTPTTNGTQREESQTDRIEPPLRHPLRPRATQNKQVYFGSIVYTRPRFRARHYSDSSTLPPRRIHEASTELGSWLTIPTTDLQRMILSAIKSAKQQQVDAKTAAKTPPKEKYQMAKPSAAVMREKEAAKFKRQINSISDAPNLPATLGGSKVTPTPQGRRNTAVHSPYMSHRRSAGCNKKIPTLRRESTSLRYMESADEVEMFMQGQRAHNLPPNQTDPRVLAHAERMEAEHQRKMEEDRRKMKARAQALVDAHYPLHDHDRVIPPKLPPTEAPEKALTFVVPSKDESKEFFPESYKEAFEEDLWDLREGIEDVPILALKPVPTQKKKKSRPAMINTGAQWSGAKPVNRPQHNFAGRAAQNPAQKFQRSPTIAFAPDPLREKSHPAENWSATHHPRPDPGNQASPQPDIPKSAELPRSILKKQSSFGSDNSRPKSATTDRNQAYKRAPVPLERAQTSMGIRQDESLDSAATWKDPPPQLKKQRSSGIFPSSKQKKKPEPLSISPQQSIAPPRSPMKRPPLSPYHPEAMSSTGGLKSRISRPMPTQQSYIYPSRNSAETVRQSSESAQSSRSHTPISRTTSGLPSPHRTMTKIDTNESTPRKLKKATSSNSIRSLFRKKSKETIITSDDIEEPFPAHLRNSLTKHKNTSLPDLRSNRITQQEAKRKEEAMKAAWWASRDSKNLSDQFLPINNETFEEFQRREEARKWSLDNARATKKNLVVPSRGKPVWEVDTKEEMVRDVEEVPVKSKLSGLKKAFGGKTKVVPETVEKRGAEKLAKIASREKKAATYGDFVSAQRGVLNKKPSNRFMGMSFGSKKDENNQTR